MPNDASDWFLSRAERGNPASAVQAGPSGSASWSDGNLVRPLVHGATYFARLHEELSALEPGDRVFFTDWRGDKDELLLPGGPTIGELLADIARAGVEVRGLVWRSHGERIRGRMSGLSNALLGREINDAGGEVLLDQRVRAFGSHHQKLFVIRHTHDPARDVAFVGGIDLCHSRRDDIRHAGDPQALEIDRRYGERPPWHDAALELRGPVVGDLLDTFSERWNDPHPLDHRNPTGCSCSVSPTCHGIRSRSPRRPRRRRRPGSTRCRCCGRTPRNGRRSRSRPRGSAASRAPTSKLSPGRAPSSTSRTSSSGRGRSSPGSRRRSGRTRRCR
ncbi:phosphatidylserine/phosphatidylglycerophosphate/cardiolipin synthase-like enzyme [Leifsonia shinshuensis]|uniref:Phosphatidylserine/phosphatidylglycerophosphate/ cardiolipin synthase-like enzyme n=1 Tax=Leifsonia shinshuensis TaxID=150026 RepID=A0A853D503_9MICO|nr:phosphatidylserine/phosphatidylglycerophosphate/cardiolipin synthase-like enzyme [Leifsonia shinshuensis]